MTHRFSAVQRVIGLLLTLFSFFMLPPALVSLYYADGSHHAFSVSFVLTLIAGTVLWWPVRRNRAELKVRDGFLVVALFWAVLGLFGALPFLHPTAPYLSVSQAVFESVSGLTTTGATVIIGLDALPHSILYYRQQLQWMGGGGIIVLAVAILPLLGVGGMSLLRAETPGPIKDNKLTPRIAETARALWFLYFGLTVLCALAFWAGGMTPFDAIGHAFSTVATGGFSTHDRSFGYFDSPLLESIAIVFMVISTINFSLHFVVWNRRAPMLYLSEPECRLFLIIAVALTAVVGTVLLYTGTVVRPGEALRQSLFHVISIGTTTGFTTANHTVWPSFLPIALLLTSFIGGCAFSTAGGMKVIRVMLLFKQGMREVQRLIHPSAEIPVKLGNKTVPDNVVQAVWGFFSVYTGFYVILFMLMTVTGMDIVTAFAAVAATVNNLGPGLGEVANNFATVEAPGLWVGAFAMLLGRLEVFTVLVLMTPGYWRR